MSINQVRDSAEDFFLQVFLMLGTVYSEQGEKQILQVLSNKFDETSQDLLGFESFLFIIRSIEIALREYDFGIEFVKQIFEKMLSANSPYLAMLKNPLNLSLKKGFCNTVKDMGGFFKHAPHLINESL